MEPTQLKGSLNDINLADIFKVLVFGGKSGVLRLSHGGHNGMIVFRGGKIIKSCTSRMDMGVGETLLHKGLIGKAVLEEARALQLVKGYVEPLGRVLIKNFNVPADEVENAAEELIRSSVMDLFTWKGAGFEFELRDYAETPEVLFSDVLQYVMRTGLDPQVLASEGAGHMASAVEPSGPAARNAVIEESALPETSFVEEDYPLPGEAGLSPEDGHAFGPKLREALEELERSTTLNEIMLLMLRFSSELFNRSIVFIQKEGQIRGFGQFGLEPEGESPDGRIKKIIMPAEEWSLLAEAVRMKRAVCRQLERTGWDAYLVEQLGKHRPVESYAAPMEIRDRAVLILYGDNGPENRKIEGLDLIEEFISKMRGAMERISNSEQPNELLRG